MVLLAFLSLSLPLMVELPAELSERQKDEILRACSSTLSPERCEEAVEGSSDARIEVLNANRFLLSVELEAERGKHTSSRELTFREEDQQEERGKAVGLSLGLMARALSEQVDSDPQLQPQAEEEISKEESSTDARQQSITSREPAKRFLIEGAGQLSLETSPVTALPGATMGLHYLANKRLSLFVSAYLHAGNVTPASTQQLALRRIGALVGLGLRQPFAWGSISLELAAGAENLWAGVTLNPSSHANQWTPTFELGLPLRVQLSQAWSLGLALRTKLYPVAPLYFVDEQRISRSSVVAPLAELGIGFSF